MRVMKVLAVARNNPSHMANSLKENNLFDIRNRVINRFNLA